MGRKNVDINIKKQYAVYAMKWCIENLGTNKRRKTPLKLSVRVRFDYETHINICGLYYCDFNKIIIYDLNCHSIKDVVSTVIHEYTHYLQPMNKYWEYLNYYYYYSTHPHEKEAIRNEIKYTNKCLRSIKKSLNNL